MVGLGLPFLAAQTPTQDIPLKVQLDVIETKFEVSSEQMLQAARATLRQLQFALHPEKALHPPSSLTTSFLSVLPTLPQ
jgi:hypothetical protein